MISFAGRISSVLCGLGLLIAVQPSPVRAAPAGAATSEASGTITAINGPWFTIQTAGRRTGVVNALVDTANELTDRDYPYVWGGGHPEAGVPSAVAGAKGHRAKEVGFDCSGSVAAVLTGAGLWPAGSPVPNDAGVIAQLLREKLIARGPGEGPVEVTLYDHPGVHIFMNIDGRFFGTSDGEGAGSANGGPGWLYDGAPDSLSHSFKQYHVLPSMLKGPSYGETLTFETGIDSGLLQAATPGSQVNVVYAASGSGTMVASALTYVGAIATSGTVVSITANLFTIETPSRGLLTFSTGASGLADELAAGDEIEVTYTASASELIARIVAVTAAATPPPGDNEGTEGPGAEPAGYGYGGYGGSGR